MSYVPAEPPYGDFHQPQDAVVVLQGGRLLDVTTYEEWRVTGRFNADIGDEDELYEFTWSQPRFPDAEGSARAFLALATNGVWGWTDGPHLHKRTVTVTEWTEVDA